MEAHAGGGGGVGGISLSRDKLHSHLQILPENKPQLQAKMMDKIPWSAYIM